MQTNYKRFWFSKAWGFSVGMQNPVHNEAPSWAQLFMVPVVSRGRARVVKANKLPAVLWVTKSLTLTWASRVFCWATCASLTCELAERRNLRPLQCLTIWQLGRVRLCDGRAQGHPGRKQHNWAWNWARLAFPCQLPSCPWLVYLWVSPTSSSWFHTGVQWISLLG